MYTIYMNRSLIFVFLFNFFFKEKVLFNLGINALAHPSRVRFEVEEISSNMFVSRIS